MSNYNIVTTTNTLDASTYWDNTASIRNVLTIDDAVDFAFQFKNQNMQPYEDWLMGLLVEVGVDKMLPKLPVSKAIAAEAAGHILNHKLTVKAVRYLEIVAVMNERR